MKSKKKKNKNDKSMKLTPTGRPRKIIEPYVLKARNLRKSLLRRSPNDKIKNTTPSIEELSKWLNRPFYICHYSLEELDIDHLTIDHKQPLNRQGDNSLSNLCFASAQMNAIKGILNDKEFRSLLELTKSWDVVAKDSLFRRLRMGHFGKR